MFHDDAEDRGLELWPLGILFGDGNEVRAEEYAADARDIEQPLGQRRFDRFRPVAHFKRAAVQHRPARQKLQSGRVGGSFGLNEHCFAPESLSLGRCLRALNPVGRRRPISNPL